MGEQEPKEGHIEYFPSSFTMCDVWTYNAMNSEKCGEELYWLEKNEKSRITSNISRPLSIYKLSNLGNQARKKWEWEIERECK